MHHLIQASTTLPNFTGKVYRGVDTKLNPTAYAVGTSITWQQFSSTSKSQQQARKFLTVNGSSLLGSIFVITVITAREIELFSAFPEEEEVLLGANSHFKVLSKLEGEAEKKAQLPDLSGYSMRDLDVYILKQL